MGILSDSHDNLPMIRKAVEVFRKEGVGYILHAGDLIAPFTAQEFRGLPCPFVAVLGNNDGEKLGLKEMYREIGSIHDGIHALEIEGRKVALTHYPEIARVIASSEAFDLVVFGHTHKPLMEKGKKSLLINPGEAGGWLYGKATIALVDLKSLEARIVEL